MPVLKHTHTYVRVPEKLMGQSCYRCEHPECSHFLNRALVKGKLSLCPKCQEHEFILTSKHLQRARPVCSNCSTDKQGRELKNIKARIEKVLNLGQKNLNLQGD